MFLCLRRLQVDRKQASIRLQTVNTGQMLKNFKAQLIGDQRRSGQREETARRGRTVILKGVLRSREVRKISLQTAPGTFPTTGRGRADKWTDPGIIGNQHGLKQRLLPFAAETIEQMRAGQHRNVRDGDDNIKWRERCSNRCCVTPLQRWKLNERLVRAATVVQCEVLCMALLVKNTLRGGKERDLAQTTAQQGMDQSCESES